MNEVAPPNLDWQVVFNRSPLDTAPLHWRGPPANDPGLRLLGV